MKQHFKWLNGKYRERDIDECKLILIWLKDQSLISLIKTWLKTKTIPYWKLK